MLQHGFHQRQQLLDCCSRAVHVPAVVQSTCSRSTGRCPANRLHAQQRSNATAVAAAGNSIKHVSCPWLLLTRPGRQLLPPPAATEGASSPGGPLQDSSRGGSSRGGGVSRGRGRGRAAGSKRSWEGSSSSGSDSGGVSDAGSQDSSWQAQAQHGGSSSSQGRGGRSSHRGRGGGRPSYAGSSSDSSWSDNDNNGAGNSSSGRGSYRGRGGSSSNSASWVQQERRGGQVRLLFLAGGIVAETG
jgi:hypothetical protein